MTPTPTEQAGGTPRPAPAAEMSEREKGADRLRKVWLGIADPDPDGWQREDAEEREDWLAVYDEATKLAAERLDPSAEPQATPDAGTVERLASVMAGRVDVSPTAAMQLATAALEFCGKEVERLRAELEKSEIARGDERYNREEDAKIQARLFDEAIRERDDQAATIAELRALQQPQPTALGLPEVREIDRLVGFEITKAAGVSTMLLNANFQALGMSARMKLEEIGWRRVPQPQAEGETDAKPKATQETVSQAACSHANQAVGAGMEVGEGVGAQPADAVHGPEVAQPAELGLPVVGSVFSAPCVIGSPLWIEQHVGGHNDAEAWFSDVLGFRYALADEGKTWRRVPQPMPSVKRGPGPNGPAKGGDEPAPQEAQGPLDRVPGDPPLDLMSALERANAAARTPAQVKLWRLKDYLSRCSGMANGQVCHALEMARADLDEARQADAKRIAELEAKLARAIRDKDTALDDNDRLRTKLGEWSRPNAGAWR